MTDPRHSFSREDRCLLDILGLQKPEWQDVNTTVLWRQATEQRVLPFLAWHIREHAKSAWSASQVKTARFVRHAALSSNLKQLALLDRIRAAFDGAGLEWISLKGPIFTARFYGDLARRTSFDLDVLVRPTDAHKADDLLKQVNLHPSKPLPLHRRPFGLTTHEHKYFCAESGALIELHLSQADTRYRILPTELAFRRKTTFVMERGTYPVLSPEDTLMHYGLHGFGHRWDRLNHVLNIACTLRANGAAWDWDYILATARSSRKVRPLLWGLALARDYLSAVLPSEVSGQIERDKTLTSLCRSPLLNDFSNENRLTTAARSLLDKLRGLESARDRFSLMAQACCKGIRGDF